MIERSKIIDGRPFKPTSSRAAALLNLPPDTPLNLVVSRGWHMHAVNRARDVKAKYDAGPLPVARAGLELQPSPLPARKGILKKSKE